VLPLTRNSALLLFASDKPVAAPPPVFLTVMAIAALVWPTVTVPKAASGGAADRLALGAAIPVPDNEMAMLPAPAELSVMMPVSVLAALGA
jgi:hypothetical protein